MRQGSSTFKDLTTSKKRGRSPLRVDLSPKSGWHLFWTDLYRWASKIAPWGPSELIGRALELAWEARRFDSAASPYDLSSTGLGPCRVETPEGQRDFVAAQERIWMASIGIRADLIAEIEHILFWISERPSKE